MEQDKTNEDLIRFWDEQIILDEQEKESLQDEEEFSEKDLAPSLKLYEDAKTFGPCKNVLDYGCGYGWASIIAAKAGAKCVDAVDLGENIIEAASFYVEHLGVGEVVSAKVIRPDWLSSVPSNTYDGIICSNVLDVVPLDTAKAIITELARVATYDAKITIGLNFHMTQEMAKERNLILDEGRYLFVNGVLRLNSMSDEEWKALLAQNFDIESLNYFAWPGEKKETRRLFHLRKKRQ